MRVKTQTLRPGSAPGSVGSSAIGARSNSCRARWEIDRKERELTQGLNRLLVERSPVGLDANREAQTSGVANQLQGVGA